MEVTYGTYQCLMGPDMKLKKKNEVGKLLNFIIEI